MGGSFLDFNGRITDSLLRWAEHHPHPDEPIFAVPGGTVLTPKELAHEVEERTEVGMEHLQMFRHIAQDDEDLGADGVIEMLESSHSDLT